MKTDQKVTVTHSLLLLLTATIWGLAFVAQSVGMQYVGPFTFNAVRFILGAATLAPLLIVRTRTLRGGGGGAAGSEGELPGTDRRVDPHVQRKAGVCCGLALGIASNLQQFGIKYNSSVGKAGFITALYIVLVPVMGLFFRQKVKKIVWGAVALAVAALYLLAMDPADGFALENGDALCLGCAFMFAVQILLVDHFVDRVDGLMLSASQFFWSAVISAPGMLLFEHPQASHLHAALLPILYAGILSCGVAYTLQVIGQRGLNPTIASLIMSLESAVSAIAGFFILHQTLSVREVIGCVLMACAIVLAQL